jgi:predicted MFS family arabinose efflux permease
VSVSNNNLAEDQQITISAKPSLWRNRDYLLLWNGQIVSTIGSQVSQLALPLLILALTHSPAQAGIAGALRTLPYLILGLPAGALVDRWNRRLVMILCDLGRFLCLVSVPIALLLGHLTILQLYVASLIEGSLYVFFDISEVACLPQVVSKEQLADATAQNIATYNIAALIGSPLGGLLYSIGRLFPFLADSISYLCSVISLLFIKTSFQQERVEAPGTLIAEISGGLKWLWEHRLFRFLALLLCSLNLVATGITLIIIVLGQRMHASAVELGLIFSVAGIAGILGSLATPLLRRHLSFFAITVCTLWPQAIVMLLLLVAPNLVILGIILAIGFFLMPIFDIVQRSQRLALIPDELQGRVNSVYRIIAFSSNPVSLALTGVLLQWIGATATVLLVAGGFALIALVATLNRDIRQVGGKEA